MRTINNDPMYLTRGNQPAPLLSSFMCPHSVTCVAYEHVKNYFLLGVM